LDNNIQPDKLIINETTKTETTAHVQDKAAIIKDILPIGKLLQNTIKQLSSAGLESINMVKAMVSAKELFPSEFNQIQLQQRQAQIDKPDTTTVSYKAISDTTKNNWFNGQVIHAKVLETHADGRATLLIDKHVIEIKLESNSQLQLKPGQNLALVVEKETKQILPNTNTATKSAASSDALVNKEAVSTDKTVIKEPATTDKTVIKEPTTTDKAVIKEPATTDKAVIKEPAITDKAVIKEPAITDKAVIKEPAITDKAVIKEPATTDKAIIKEQINSDRIKNKEASSSEKIRFLLSNPPEQSSKLIQLIQSMVIKQQSLSPLLASLDSVFQYTHAEKTKPSTISDTSKAMSEKLPTPIVNAIQKLLNQFSSTTQLSMSEGLKQAIINSGLFLENRLQIQKTDNIDLSSLLLNQKMTKNRFQSASNIIENNHALSQAINKLIALSQNLSQRINSNVSIPAEIIQLFNKNTANASQNNIHLSNSQENINQLFNKNQQITTQATTINEILSKLNLINQNLEKTLTPASNKNVYPKEYSQSINQLLENISKQFNDKNQTLLANKNHSYARTQAVQFNTQLQQVNQSLSLAIANNNPQTTINPQINNDLRLNLQRLLSVIQELASTERAQTTSSQNKLSSSLLQHLSTPESELNRPALSTRNKHAQVIMAQQNQLLQIANPLIFQQTLAEQLEGVMSRIIATQAASREQADSNINMALEIPFKFQDKSQVLQLKFTSKNKDKDKSKEKIWSANLAFELQSLGAIRIYILLDGKDISMQFWTEKDTTQQVFAKNFSILRERLILAGYNISEMTATLGIPQEAKEESNKNKEGVIDERV
jgi:hypothetical protein